MRFYKIHRTWPAFLALLITATTAAPAVPPSSDLTQEAAPATSPRPAPAQIGSSAPASTARKPWAPPSHMPDRDEWYRPPAGYERTAPGAILKTRHVPKGISLDNKNTLKLAGAWQIQYRTTNSVGAPDVTVTTLLVPYNAKKKDLFTYHWFTDAAYQDCNPSLAMQVGTRSDNLYTQQENHIVLAALSQGWYVNVPDDGGYAARFANGKYAGQAVLDSLRAVKKSSALSGIDPDPTIVTFGYSGGSISGAWAAELQPTYAPDVKLAGVTIGGIVANLTENLRLVEPIIARTAYSVSSVAGLARDFPSMIEWLDDNLVPATANEFRAVFSQCLWSNYDMYTNKSFGAYFKDGYQSLFTSVPLDTMTKVATLGLSGVPKAPIYAFMVATDEATPVGPVDKLINTYCARGANILYERNPVEMSHTQELLDALPGALRWMTDRFEGIPAMQGCRTMNRTSESVRGQQQKMLYVSMIGNVLAYVGGLKVGPSAWTSWLSEFRPSTAPS